MVVHHLICERSPRVAEAPDAEPVPAAGQCCEPPGAAHIQDDCPATLSVNERQVIRPPIVPTQLLQHTPSPPSWNCCMQHAVLKVRSHSGHCRTDQAPCGAAKPQCLTRATV